MQGDATRCTIEAEAERLLTAAGQTLSSPQSERSRGPPRRRPTFTSALNQLVAGISGTPAPELPAGQPAPVPQGFGRTSAPACGGGIRRVVSPCLSRAASAALEATSELPRSCDTTQSLARSQTCVAVLEGGGRAEGLRAALEQHLSSRRPSTGTGVVPSLCSAGDGPSGVGVGVPAGGSGAPEILRSAPQDVEEDASGLSEVIDAWEAARRAKGERDRQLKLQEESQDAALRHLQLVLQQPSLIRGHTGGLQHLQQPLGSCSAVKRTFRKLFRALAPQGSLGGMPSGSGSARHSGKRTPSVAGSAASRATSSVMGSSRQLLFTHNDAFISSTGQTAELGSTGSDGVAVAAAAAGGGGAIAVAAAAAAGCSVERTAGSSGGSATPERPSPPRTGSLLGPLRSRLSAHSAQSSALGSPTASPNAATRMALQGLVTLPVGRAAAARQPVFARRYHAERQQPLESILDEGSHRPEGSVHSGSFALGTLELADALLQPPGKGPGEVAAAAAAAPVPAPQVPPAGRSGTKGFTVTVPAGSAPAGAREQISLAPPLHGAAVRPLSGQAPRLFVEEGEEAAGKLGAAPTSDGATLAPHPACDTSCEADLVLLARSDNHQLSPGPASRGETDGAIMAYSTGRSSAHSVNSRTSGTASGTASAGLPVVWPVHPGGLVAARRSSVGGPDDPWVSPRMSANARGSVSEFVQSTELVELTAMHIQQDGVQLSEAVLAAARGTAGASGAHASRPLEFRPLAAARDSLYGTLEPSAKPEPAARGSSAGREEEAVAATGTPELVILPEMSTICSEVEEDGGERESPPGTGGGLPQLLRSQAVHVHGAEAGSAVVARRFGHQAAWAPRPSAPWLALPWGSGGRSQKVNTVTRAASEGSALVGLRGQQEAAGTNGDVLLPLGGNVRGKVPGHAASDMRSQHVELMPPPPMAAVVSPEVAVSGAVVAAGGGGGGVTEAVGVRFGELRLVRVKGAVTLACCLHNG